VCARRSRPGADGAHHATRTDAVLERPVLWPSPPWDAVTYWALDLETGGLDPRTDAILSVGMVPVRSGGIRLGEAYASLVQPARETAIAPSSIAAHHLVPRDVREAPPLAAVLAEVDGRLREAERTGGAGRAGRAGAGHGAHGGAPAVLLVHQAAIDVAFLRRGYRQAGLRWPDPHVVDTVALLLRAAKRARFVDPNAPEQEPDLNLASARRRLGLPDYGQHDALTDAIAAAELFLVLRRRLGARKLRDLR
jgi:DNA polymerase III subunit epsilon